MELKNTLLYKKVYGALTGGVVGDAMGGPVEGWKYEKIQEKYGWIEELVTDSGWNGQYTDDTYLKNALAEHYILKKKHFTAHDVVDMWAKLDDKYLWLPEKYTFLLAAHMEIDPFFTGQGNMVICGSAMAIPPVGLVNPGNPERAYAEAASVAAINTHSYGLEGAAVLAAGIAEAMSPNATRDSVFQAAIDVAHHGTKKCLMEVYEEVKKHTNVKEAIVPVREITMRWDGRLEGTNPSTASHHRCLEEVAATFAMMYLCDGNVQTAIEGGVNFGQDNDSIAGMVGALAGALYAGAGLKEHIIKQIEETNNYDAEDLALRFTETVIEINKKDREKLASFETLV